MVNYCCVSGCGRNSRSSKLLNYYSLPRERARQIEWLKVGGREDLIEKSQDKLGYRFCSRHFEPNSIKNKHLKPDAVPTLHLPGSRLEDDSDSDEVQHDDILCNHCKEPIVGFRYKCVTCPDYDLCATCENIQTHSEHYMLRMSRPMFNDKTDKLMNQMKNILNSSEELSSDDEPITKYTRNYDSGVDLSEDMKVKIRKEVNRALSTRYTKKIKTSKKREAESSRSSKRQKQSKTNVEEEGSWPELVFVDGHMPVVKMEAEHPENSEQNMQDDNMEQPAVHVKISEDFNLILEPPEQPMYKYS